jgi:hypothetical protein
MLLSRAIFNASGSHIFDAGSENHHLITTAAPSEHHKPAIYPNASCKKHRDALCAEMQRLPGQMPSRMCFEQCCCFDASTVASSLSQCRRLPAISLAHLDYSAASWYIRASLGIRTKHSGAVDVHRQQHSSRLDAAFGNCEARENQ